MIPKIYHCILCGKETIIRSRKKCNRCRYKERLANNEIKHKINKSNRKELLNRYFTYHLEKIKINPYCENCGSKLSCNISNIAHIFPKRFGANPEVMGELDNYMYLCSAINNDGQACHDHYDKIQGSSKIYLMRCFPIAFKRYLIFKDEVKYSKYKSIFESWKKDENGLYKDIRE